MRRVFLFSLFLVLAGVASLSADELIRRAQEELRKRNLYFGDVDGQPSPQFEEALRRYQVGKGLPVTGQIDDETTKSLDVTAATPAKPQLVATSALPDTPVLRSDAAREIPEKERAALVAGAEKDITVAPTPMPSLPKGTLVAVPPSPAVTVQENSEAERPLGPTSGSRPVLAASSPSGTTAPPTVADASVSPAPVVEPAQETLNPDQVQRFVEEYLRAGQTDDVEAQLKFYSFPVQYFDHGRVERAFVARDTRNYVKRWPERRYELTEPVSFSAAERDREFLVEFPLNFSVKNQRHTASGKTRNFWRIRAENSELKIVAIREERLRD